MCLEFTLGEEDFNRLDLIGVCLMKKQFCDQEMVSFICEGVVWKLDAKRWIRRIEQRCESVR